MNYDFWFWFSVVANWCQIESYQMNQKQIDNDAIFKKLQEQDKVLDEQIHTYLEKIVTQNDIIINLLKEIRNENNNKNGRGNV